MSAPRTAVAGFSCTSSANASSLTRARTKADLVAGYDSAGNIIAPRYSQKDEPISPQPMMASLSTTGFASGRPRASGIDRHLRVRLERRGMVSNEHRSSVQACGRSASIAHHSSGLETT